MPKNADARILVVIPCHNRRVQTLTCLRVLLNPRNRVVPDVLVVDDGSTDGTSTAIAQEFPSVELADGTGDLYWGGAMNLGIERFLSSDHSHLLWLNDDVFLHDDALAHALERIEDGGEDILVAGCVDDEGQATYGAVYRESRLKPLTFKLIEPRHSGWIGVDTFNGNFVLFTREAVSRTGLIDSTFRHRMGDYDYGLRASRLGLTIGLLGEPAGLCNRNAVGDTFLDRDLPRIERMRHMLSEKGMPPGPWAKFCLRHGGLIGPIAIFKPYLNVLLKR